jgi:hypothetical protein
VATCQFGEDQMEPNPFPITSSDALGNQSVGKGEILRAQSSAAKVHSLIIVARDQPDLWQALVGQFAGNTKVQVLQDRRRWGRRQRVQTYEPDRRGLDRRRPPRLEHDVRCRSFVIIPQREGVL